MASITFNGTELIRKLDVFAKVQVPFAAALAVNRIATQVRQDLQHEILDSFTYVSAFTYKSPMQRHLATKAEPWTEVFLRDEAGKGTAPATYLLPQIQGGLVFGLTAALYGEITFDKGVVQQSNFDGYPLLAMSAMPRTCRPWRRHRSTSWC